MKIAFCHYSSQHKLGNLLVLSKAGTYVKQAAKGGGTAQRREYERFDSLGSIENKSTGESSQVYICLRNVIIFPLNYHLITLISSPKKEHYDVRTYLGHIQYLFISSLYS